MALKHPLPAIEQLVNEIWVACN